MSSTFHFLGTALLLVVGLLACDPPYRAVEGGDVVNLYSNSLSASDQELFAPFEKSSGLKVNIIFRPGDKVIERIQELDSDSTNADILLLEGVEYLYKAQRSGMLDTLPRSSFLTAIPPHLQDEAQQWLSLGHSAYVIAYRRDSVDTLQVQNYQQLADERWKNRLILTQEEDAYTSLLASLLADESSETTQNWWNSLLENRDSSLDSLSLLQLVNTAKYRRKPAWDIRFHQSETYLQLTGVAIRKQAPHPNRAESLFNYMFSREFMRRFAEKHRLYPSRTDVQSPSPLPKINALRADTTSQSRIARFTEEARSMLSHEAPTP